MNFTAHDRCDQCGAQALAKVTKPIIPATLEELEFTSAEHELMFCGHHMNEHAEALSEAGFIVAVRESIEPEPV